MAEERPMAVKRQFAAGGVIVKKDRGQLRVFLIRDSYGHWSWPKGHIEKGETPEEAGLREISEETGLKRIRIEGKLGEQRYSFTLNNKRISKTVHVFLVKARPGERPVIQTSEIEEGRWFRDEDALDTIWYKGSKELLKKGIDLFRKKYCRSQGSAP